jgi:nuclear transport factor 2 (NTF2) superfamily protein
LERAFAENRIAVRFAYGWHDDSLNWFRSCKNEDWDFDFAADGLMQRRRARDPIVVTKACYLARSPVMTASSA